MKLIQLGKTVASMLIVAALALQSTPSRAEQPLSVYIISANWCDYCTQLHEMLRQNGMDRQVRLPTASPDGSTRTALIRIHFIDIDQNPLDARRRGYNGHAIPFFSFYRGGTQSGFRAGSLPPNHEAFIRVLRDQLELPEPSPTSQSTQQRHENVARASRRLIDERTNRPIQLRRGGSAALLISTGASPREVPVFNGVRLSEARRLLEGPLGMSSQEVIALYGSREGIFRGHDTIQNNSGREEFTTIPEVNPSGSFTTLNLRKFLHSAGQAGLDKLLLMFAGHGSPSGVSTWHPDSEDVDYVDLGPELLRHWIDGSGIQKTVLISGTCYSGTFWNSASCGFFAADQENMAAGCYPNSADPIVDSQRHDYLREWVRAIQNSSQNPRPERLSFAEIHSRAAMNLDLTEVPYSSSDAFIDQYLEQIPITDSPTFLDQEAFTRLKAYATPAELSWLERVFNQDHFLNGFFRESQFPFRFDRRDGISPIFEVVAFNHKVGGQIVNDLDGIRAMDRNRLSIRYGKSYRNSQALSYGLPGSSRDALISRIRATDPEARAAERVFPWCNETVFYDPTSLDRSTGRPSGNLMCLFYDPQNNRFYGSLILRVATGSTLGEYLDHFVPYAWIRTPEERSTGFSAIARVQHMLRRLWFRKAMRDHSVSEVDLQEYATIQECENQDIREFLQPHTTGGR